MKIRSLTRNNVALTSHRTGYDGCMPYGAAQTIVPPDASIDKGVTMPTVHERIVDVDEANFPDPVFRDWVYTRFGPEMDSSRIVDVNASATSRYLQQLA